MPEMLSIAEIVRRVGMDRSTLDRYLKYPDNREALQGASTHPQYPADALPLFFRLAQEDADNAITPKTLAGRWKADSDNRLAISENRLAKTDNPDTVAVSLLARIADNTQATRPADRLLTLAQAREEYGISAGTFRRLSVIEGRRRVVKLSAVQEYIRGL